MLIFLGNISTGATTCIVDNAPHVMQYPAQLRQKHWLYKCRTWLMHVVTNNSGMPFGYNPSGALRVSGSPCSRISVRPVCRYIAPHAIWIRRRAIRTWRVCVLGEVIGAVAMADRKS